jgi:hypothetical protein
MRTVARRAFGEPADGFPPDPAGVVGVDSAFPQLARASAATTVAHRAARRGVLLVMVSSQLCTRPPPAVG